MNWMTDFMVTQSENKRPSKAQRDKTYQRAMKDYKKAFRAMKVEDCHWTEMRRLIGSNYEAMAYIHGAEPTHGFRCVGKRKIERNKGYPRYHDFFGNWVKSSNGEWLYYGPFRDAKFKARRQTLDPEVLENPERAVSRQKFRDDLISRLK